MAVTELVAEKFDETITENDIVVIDFWAPWCGPCKSFAPTFEKIAAENEDIRFVKVNTDEQQALAGHFGIRSIPTLMVFREQVIVFQQPGAMPKGMLDELIGQVRELDMAAIRADAKPFRAADDETGEA
ncbi:MAG: thioredoxin [Burkholderiaceae bacterium]|nr:thioredoxin [Burkholderiaceae bacterium]